MKSMVFEDSVFEECYFEDITSTHTFFRNCTFIASLFYNTGKNNWAEQSEVEFGDAIKGE